jgi:hypothetical protein
MRAASLRVPKHSWKFYLLWPNLAVAVVYLVLLATNQFSTAHDFAQALVRSAIYANLTALLGMLFVLALAE